MNIRRVHHINFLVSDLEAAIARYEQTLGLRHDRVDELPGRGVRAARFRVGETWIVLVQPVADGDAKRTLERDGEGFFLISYEVDDLEAAADHARRSGVPTTSGQPRIGLDGWRVIDLEPGRMRGALVQLCEVPRP